MEGLKEFVEDDQLTEDLGGSLKFNFDEWIKCRFEEEGVSLDNPNDLLHVISPDIVATFSDRVLLFFLFFYFFLVIFCLIK